jgi:protein-tyrosine-phosphatase
MRGIAAWKNGGGDVYFVFRVAEGAVWKRFSGQDMRGLFVCTGNTCRSPMAEGYFRKLAVEAGVDVEAASAGVSAPAGAPPSSNAVAVARRFGVDISGFRSAPLTLEEIRRSDLVVPMTASHEAAVLAVDPGAAGKTRRLGKFAAGGDVGDPFGGGLEVYQACFDGMKVALDRLFEKVRHKEI